MDLLDFEDEPNPSTIRIASEHKITYREKFISEQLLPNAWVKFGDKYFPVSQHVLNFLDFFTNIPIDLTLIIHEDKPVIFVYDREENIELESINIGKTQDDGYLTVDNFKFLYEVIYKYLVFGKFGTPPENILDQVNFILIINYFASKKETVEILDIDSINLNAWLRLMAYKYLCPKLFFGEENCKKIFRKIFDTKKTTYDIIVQALKFYGMDGDYGSILETTTILNKYRDNCVVYDPRKNMIFDFVRFSDGHVILFNPVSIIDGIGIEEVERAIIPENKNEHINAHKFINNCLKNSDIPNQKSKKLNKEFKFTITSSELLPISQKGIIYLTSFDVYNIITVKVGEKFNVVRDNNEANNEFYLLIIGRPNDDLDREYIISWLINGCRKDDTIIDKCIIVHDASKLSRLHKKQ